MKNESGINYFKIGAFILTGLALIVIAILVFGSNKLFQPTVYIETYFDESVQGISEGYPVKYRGLQIGYVKKIAFTREIYENDAEFDNNSNQNRSRSIYVLLAITSKLFTHLTNDELRDLLNSEVAAGLRVKIMPQGITGTTYIEFNYVDPKNNKVPKIYWAPRNFYIPSYPSILTQIGNNAQILLEKITSIDFKKLFNNINTLTVSLDQVAQKTNLLIDKNKKTIEVTLKNTLEVSENLKMLTEQLKLYPSQLIFSGTPPQIDPAKL